MTALITGVSGNLGQAVAKKFLQEGYLVAGTVLPDDRLPLNFPADKFEKIVVDLTDTQAAENSVESLIKKHGAIDAAILTVGGFAMGSVAQTGTEAIRKQYQLNFETTYNVVRPLFVHMLQQKRGRIFMIGSKPGLSAKNGAGMIAYGLAKSLIFRLAELMNEEAKGSEVVTSVVVPSTIDTAINRRSMPDANFDNWVKPEKIAEAIYWYCTEAAAAIREPVIKLYHNA